MCNGYRNRFIQSSSLQNPRSQLTENKEPQWRYDSITWSPSNCWHGNLSPVDNTWREMAFSSVCWSYLSEDPQRLVASFIICFNSNSSVALIFGLYSTSLLSFDDSRTLLNYPTNSRGLRLPISMHRLIAFFIRGVSRVICECFLEALVMANCAEGTPLGGPGVCPPRKFLKIDPQRCNLVHFETKR